MLDVVVIGAGFSGLYAAYNLYKKGLKFTLLEARQRVGGRAYDFDIGFGHRLELGGQYICDEQKLINELLQELNLKTFPAWSRGDNFILLKDQVLKNTLSPAQNFGNEIEEAIKKLEALLEVVPGATPWTCYESKEWDGITFQSWIVENLRTDVGRQFFRCLVNQAYSTEPEQISLLQMLWFLKTSHGIPPWAVGGPQANRVLGGTERVATEMAVKVSKSLKFGEKVLGIYQDEEKVEVFTQNHRYQAKSALIAIPPQLINRIDFKPTLNPDLYRAFAAMQSGNAMKVQAIYKKPFWREKGLSGCGLTFDGPQTFTYDNSGPEGLPGVLLGFITASKATYWNQKSIEERRDAVLATWMKVFGEEVLQLEKYIEMDWMWESFTRGAHGCHFPPGVWNELGPALGGDHLPRAGRVLFAASDLAKDWVGTLEGALQAGAHAVRQLEKSVLYAAT